MDNVVLTHGRRASKKSVPHVHFHLLPWGLQDNQFVGRQSDDKLEKREGALPQDLAAAASVSHTDSVSPEPLRMDADAARKPRTPEDGGRSEVACGLFRRDR